MCNPKPSVHDSSTLINLHPDEYSQRLHYYPLAVNLDRRVKRYNTLNDLLI